MSGMILHTSDLTVGYRGVPLIRGIALELRRGEILTLIGPNGSGKSTILKSLLGYLKPIRGAVYLDGQALGRFSGAARAKRMSVVLTDRLRPERMTCREVVVSGRYPYTGRLGLMTPDDWEKVDGAMALIQVSELRDRDFTKISDGQRQRVMLARAICQEPEVILLDEPASFLDIHHKLRLLTILRQMVEKYHLAVVLTMHEIDLAQKISDRVLCVKGEVISACGPPEEIFTPARINELYGLEHGSYNALFGSVELPPPAGAPRVFVVAGGGTGIPVYRRLQKLGLPFYTGVLHENDVDFQAASALAAGVISEIPFEPISDGRCLAALEKLRLCDALVCPLSHFGAGNRKNEQLLAEAGRMGLKVIKNLDELPSILNLKERME